MRLHSRDRARGEPDIHIHARVQRLPGPHSSHQANRNFGMLPGKARQPREQPLSCKPERHSDHELLLPTISEKRSEEHTSELQSQSNLVCRLLLAKKKELTKRAST